MFRTLNWYFKCTYNVKQLLPSFLLHSKHLLLYYDYTEWIVWDKLLGSLHKILFNLNCVLISDSITQRLKILLDAYLRCCHSITWKWKFYISWNVNVTEHELKWMLSNSSSSCYCSIGISTEKTDFCYHITAPSSILIHVYYINEE